MNDLREKYDRINSANDLRILATETEDGESPVFEMKRLCSDSFSGDKIGETKAILAKEICAFLNTNDGIVAWGAEQNEDGDIIIRNDSQKNLVDFFDCFSSIIVEPAPAGIQFKSLSDTDGNTCLLLYIPRSNLAPHRVGTWDVQEGKKSKDKKTGRYFQRVGTKSQVMPENIVRAMYCSNGRIPHVETQIELEVSLDRKINLSVIIEPDPLLFIENYYIKNRCAFINSNLQILRTETDGWYDVGSQFTKAENTPIYPSVDKYRLDGSRVLPSVLPLTSSMDENIYLGPTKFTQIFAVITESSFACENVPLKTKRRLYILGGQAYWGSPDYAFRRLKILAGIENEFAMEIYVANFLYDEVDNIYTSLSDNDKAWFSMLEQSLKRIITEP